MSSVELQTTAPLVEALKLSAFRASAAFHTPGHKRGGGAPAVLDWWGKPIFQADLPELPELDNLFAPTGVIQQAQTLAAEAFGAEQTWFLANGSTSGLAAMILATCRTGEKIILPRNVHRSVISALILSGAQPVFLQPAYDPQWEIAHGLDPETIAAALAQHPDAKAVLVVSPTYYGVCSDLQRIAQITHQSDLPLLVDEAHGPHFAFHPDLPASALSAGADLVVQSTHKVLSGLTQAAMLHGQGQRIDRDRVSQMLQLVQSTSPNYLLLASLDAARQQMATHGHDLMSQTLALASRARQELRTIAGLSVLGKETGPVRSPGFGDLDPTRLTIGVQGLHQTGFAIDEMLHQTFQVTAELPTLHHLTFIISLGNSTQDIDRLIQAFTQLAAAAADRDSRPFTNPEINFCKSAAIFFPIALPGSPAPLTPRAAFFAAAEIVPIAQAIGRISAALVCPYPPGIPVLMPGEGVTAAAIDYLQQVMVAGGVVTGCADGTLQHLQVVKTTD